MITPQSAAAGCKVVKTSEEPAWEQQELPSAPGTHQQRSTTVPYRSLIYDANLGCLRFSRHSAGGGPGGGGGARGTAAAAADCCISAGSPQHGAENFRPLLLPESKYSSSGLASCRQQRNKAWHQYHNDDADECSDVQDSGDSSPTCVIGNATMLCSSSTSPSLSSLSKATSIDMDHHLQAASDVYSVEVKELISKNCSNGASLLHLDQGGRNDHEPVFYSPSRNEMLLLKQQGRGNKKLLGLMDTPGKPGMKGGSFGKRLESKETSSSSNWASVHNTLHLVDATATNEVAFMTKNSLALRDTHSSKEAQTMPFKSIQSPSSMMDQKSSSAAESENWKKRTGASTGMIVSAAGSQPSTQQQPQPQPGSVLNGSGSIFSFNSTHSARGTADAAAAAAAAAAEGYDYDSKFEKDSSSASFDFNRPSGAHRAATAAVGPLLKPTPSKWDDAQKWLSASDQAPGNATAKSISKCKSGPMQQQQGGGGATTVSTKKVTFSNLSAAGRQSATANGGGGAATTHISKPTNAVAENCGGRDAPSSSAPSVELIEGGVAAGTAMSRGGGAVDRYPLNDLYEGSSSRSSPDASDKSLKPARLRTAKPTSESATEGWVESLADYPGAAADSSSSLAVNTRGGGGAAVVVSTRDMGTEMTPIASVEPSRTATPVRATTPNSGSPINSRPSSPDTRRVMTVPSSTPTSESKKNSSSSSSSCSTGVEKQEATDKRHSHDHCMMQSTTTTTTTPSSSSSCTTTTTSSSSSSSSSSKVLSSKELQAKTRQEILALGTQLGKANIAAWATKEEEEADAAKALQTSVELEEVRKSLHSSRATAWEEAEQAKYAARYKREEAKIQAWENHEKAKAEAEMRRIEVKVERMWSHANEKLMNKLAAAHRQAEDLRAAAEARKSEQIAKAASRAEYIRGTGKMPTSFFARFCQ